MLLLTFGFKMIKFVFWLSVLPILIVAASNDICLKAYKRQLCFKKSIQNYDLCLFQQFNVYEQNNKFCVTNTKCVSKYPPCFGFLLQHFVYVIFYFEEYVIKI